MTAKCSTLFNTNNFTLCCRTVGKTAGNRYIAAIKKPYN